MKERTNKSIRYFLIIVVTILVVALNISIVSAATSVNLISWDGRTHEDSYKEFDFYLEKDGVLSMNFSYNYLNQDYDIQIIDSNGNIVYEDYYYDDDDTSEVDLKKGGYTLIASSDNEMAFSINVSVKYKQTAPSYSTLVKKAKKLTTKYIWFDNIDVGYHSRLYGRGISDAVLNESKIYTMAAGFQPYIDMRKDNGKVKLRLMMKGEVILFSLNSNPMYLDNLRLYTSNRTITYDLSSCKEKESYSYKDGFYTNTSKWFCQISSNSNVKKTELDKLKKILKQKNPRIRVRETDGAYFRITLTENQRKNWLGVINRYEKLLSLYD